MSRRYLPSITENSDSTVSSSGTEPVVPHSSRADEIRVLTKGSQGQLCLVVGNKAAAAALFPTTRQSCPWLPLVRTRISSARLECGTTGSVPLEDTLLSEFSVIEGKYLRDILNQPQALEDTLAGLEELKKSRELAARLEKGTFKTVVLTGMGSSFHALHPLHLELINHGLTAIMVETSELVHYQSRLFDPKTLIVVVSQSGQSAEAVRLLEINRGKSSVIAITNTPDSPLAAQADATILTQAGKEFSVL